MKRFCPHLSMMLLALLLLAACNTTYQTATEETKPAPAQLSEAERQALDLEMRKARSFAYEYYKQNNYEEAKSYYLRLFEMDTEYEYSADLKKLADCYSNLAMPDSARFFLELAVELRPEEHYEHRVLGMLLKQSGDTNAALAEFKACVALDPEDWQSHADIMNIYLDRAEDSDSVEDYDRVLEVLDTLITLRPEDAEYAKTKDRILAEHYDPEEIIASLRRNHEQFPDDLNTTRKLARALVEYATAETFKETLVLVEQLLAADPVSVPALEMKATALEGLSRLAEAVQVLEQMVEIQRDKADLVERVGRTYLELGQLKNARNWARRCERSFPEYGKGYILMANVYEEAVNQCASAEGLDFDDKLVYELAYNEYDKVSDGSRSLARARRSSLEEVLPTAGDRFFNKYDLPKKECYQWLLN